MMESVAIGVSACLRLVLPLRDLDNYRFLLRIPYLEQDKQFPRWFVFRSMIGLFQPGSTVHTNIMGGKEEANPFIFIP